jgi:hypothetical protein
MNKKTTLVRALLFAGIATSASAMVLTNPLRVGGQKAIDPKGVIAKELVPANAVSKEEIIALPSFRSVQVFGASGKFFEPKQNIINFTGTNDMVPDVELTFGGYDTTPQSGAAIFNVNYTSSDGIAIRLEATGSAVPKSKSMNAVLKFGDYNTDSNTFTPASVVSGKAPVAVAFTLTGQGKRTYMLDSIVVVFKDTEGNVLETQALTGLTIPNDAKPRAAYFAFKSTGARIGSVLITATTQEIKYSATPLLGLDDLGFAR